MADQANPAPPRTLTDEFHDLNDALLRTQRLLDIGKFLLEKFPNEFERGHTEDALVPAAATGQPQAPNTIAAAAAAPPPAQGPRPIVAAPAPQAPAPQAPASAARGDRSNTPAIITGAKRPAEAAASGGGAAKSAIAPAARQPQAPNIAAVAAAAAAAVVAPAPAPATRPPGQQEVTLAALHASPGGQNNTRALLQLAMAISRNSFVGKTPGASLRSNGLRPLKRLRLVDKSTTQRSVWRLHDERNNMAGWTTGP
jgi:hypothetical protein